MWLAHRHNSDAQNAPYFYKEYVGIQLTAVSNCHSWDGDFTLSLNDASSEVMNCPVNGSVRYEPLEPFSDFNGMFAAGDNELQLVVLNHNVSANGYQWFHMPYNISAHFLNPSCAAEAQFSCMNGKCVTPALCQ
jgi:hypothetical protein